MGARVSFVEDTTVNLIVRRYETGLRQSAISVEQRPDKPQERVLFWTIGSIPEEFTYRRVGYLSTGAKIRLMLHDRHIGGRVAGQRPGVAVAAFVQNTFSHG